MMASNFNSITVAVLVILRGVGGIAATVKGVW